MTEGGEPADDPLWRFSLDVYGRPGAAAACLALQDGAGADVNVLLYLLWCAATGRRLGIAGVRAADASVAGWRTAIVEPLRGVRRALKAGPLAERAPAAYRDRIKAAELDAERVAQAILRAGAPEPAGGLDRGAAAREHLRLYAQHLGRPLPEAATAVLLDACAPH